MAPLSLLMLLSSAAQGATWAVGPTQALTTIGDALAVAGPADTIEIDPGTYVEDVVITVDDLHLHGLGGVTLAAAGALDVVVVAAGGVVLEGLTVDGDRVARGVRVDDGSSASLVDCRIVDGNRAEGAGLWVGNGSVVSVDATAFEGNTASDDGGAIFASTSSSLQVLRSTFLTNSGDLGGAIACMNGPAPATSSTRTSRATTPHASVAAFAWSRSRARSAARCSATTSARTAGPSRARPATSRSPTRSSSTTWPPSRAGPYESTTPHRLD